LRKTATFKKELLKPVMLNYIKYHIKIKKNGRGLYTNKKKVIDHSSIYNNRVALTKTCLRKIDLSLAFFVKGLKKEPLKNLIKYTNNCD
jgi:hypothetical protein